MKISFQGERVAFTLNLSFGFKFKPSNKTLREWRKHNQQYSKEPNSFTNKYQEYTITKDIN